ncbi:MAG: ArsR family transcriptional regulator [Candidatus Zixiibacteriota bacterium]|nr:MAG: ArsR family transcriptional regulator [candidate division Zixibacteria bacterium]
MTCADVIITYGTMLDHKNGQLREVLEMHKALSDANRLRALIALSGKELCVCQSTELLKLAPSTVSKHLSILKQARLVEMRKVGRWIYYRLSDRSTSSVSAEYIRLLEKTLSNDPQIKDDRKRLKEILKMDADALCRRM